MMIVVGNFMGQITWGAITKEPSYAGNCTVLHMLTSLRARCFTTARHSFQLFLQDLYEGFNKASFWILVQFAYFVFSCLHSAVKAHSHSWAAFDQIGYFQFACVDARCHRIIICLIACASECQYKGMCVHLSSCESCLPKAP